MVSSHMDVVERSKQWLLAQQERLVVSAQRQADSELSQLREVPRIDPVSERLSQQRSSVDISTRLYKDAEKLRDARRQLEEDALVTFHGVVGMPSITKRAALIQRDGDIADRLYNQAKESAVKKQQAIEAAQSQPPYSGRSSDFGSTSLGKTGAAGSAMRTMSTSRLAAATINAPRHTLDDLYRMGLEAKARKEALAKKAAEEARAAACPKLNRFVPVVW